MAQTRDWPEPESRARLWCRSSSRTNLWFAYEQPWFAATQTRIQTTLHVHHSSAERVWNGTVSGGATMNRLPVWATNSLWLIAAIVSLVLLFASAVSLSVLAKGTPEPITATVGVGQGITLEPLADIPSLVGIAPSASAALHRITYLPGATLEPAYAGPVAYYVEQGTLELRYQPGEPKGLGFSGVGSSLRSTADGFVQLSSGAAVFSPTGDLGLTRNQTSTPVVVLAILIVNEQGTSEG